MKKTKVLVIGDPHEPFCLDGYLDFCKKQYKKWRCQTVVFIGDIIDNHAASFHRDDSDAMGGADELELAIEKIGKWHEAFPKAYVIIGNHDRMVMRKAQESRIPTAWIKSYKEVLNTPDWDFVDRVVIDGVQYIHGEGGTARTRALRDMMSTVQGHLHSQAYIDYHVGDRDRVFAVQTGCGINHQTYAMAYAKNFPKPKIFCSVILRGTQPILIPMELGKR